MFDASNTVTTILAEWASRLRFDDLRTDVVAGTTDRILDALGVEFAGARTDFGRKLAAALGAGGQRQSCAGAMTLPVLTGALTSCLDFDDTHDATLIHPTGTTLFAALGVTGSTSITGKDLITATTLGVEIACRIASAAPRAFHSRGLHPTGVLAVFGGAAAAAWLLDRRAPTIRNALGLAGSFGAGLMQPFVDGTEQRYLHSGNAAAGGLLAARAAAEGIQGSPEVLEGRFGLFATHVPDAAPFDFAAVIADLNVKWECQSVSLKRYPTGYVTHPYIDAALALAAEPDFEPEQVERLVCVVPPNAVALVCEPRAEKLAPRSAVLARISLPHMLAEAMIYGSVDAESFSDERLADPRVRRLAARIEYAVAGPAGQERLIVHRRGQDTRDIPIHTRRMTRSDVVEKFVANTRAALGLTQARRIADDILNLDAASNAAELLLPFLAHGRGAQTL